MNQRQLMAVLGGANEPEREPLPREQQIAMLREVHASRQNADHFEPGDLLEYKLPRVNASRHAEEVSVFVTYLAEPVCGWEYIDQPSDITSYTSAIIYDCVIGQLESDGIYVQFLENSADMRKLPE